jgi:hypothetical protein
MVRARALRLEYEGAVIHLGGRANRRARIFYRAGAPDWRMMIHRNAIPSCIALIALISACATSGSAPSLSRADAIRIADAQAKREKHVDLREYEHWPVAFYKEGAGTWVIEEKASVL